ARLARGQARGRRGRRIASSAGPPRGAGPPRVGGRALSPRRHRPLPLAWRRALRRRRSRPPLHRGVATDLRGPARARAGFHPGGASTVSCAFEMSEDRDERLDHPFHAMTVEDVAEVVGVDPQAGVRSDEVVRRRARYGENTLSKHEARSFLERLAGQFHNPFIYVLLVAAVITAA